MVAAKSVLTQIRQLILEISNSQGQFDGFVGELTDLWGKLLQVDGFIGDTSAKRL